MFEKYYISRDISKMANCKRRKMLVSKEFKTNKDHHRRLFAVIIVPLFIMSCAKKQVSGPLIRVEYDATHEIGTPCAYVDSAGHTIVPKGKYAHCFTDTIHDLGMVVEKETGKIIGIDQNGIELFEVFKFDNGPDYVENGLFRIIKNGKIGYADVKGRIVIEPVFDCAYPFEEGYAQVSESCQVERGGEHSSWKSDQWYYITTDGKRSQKKGSSDF